eukprot:TRINITY_DN1076_c0_g4_i1.p1 TRINITY_DN1076_c0_g4~~TRINITY_DN1076_c0_g4_i1.p1  ORF type:complete len:321 (+),score=149.27 TRINITY_DN1076_c0_g4_i1:28-963(+)
MYSNHYTSGQYTQPLIPPNNNNMNNSMMYGSKVYGNSAPYQPQQPQQQNQQHPQQQQHQQQHPQQQPNNNYQTGYNSGPYQPFPPNNNNNYYPNNNFGFNSSQQQSPYSQIQAPNSNRMTGWYAQYFQMLSPPEVQQLLQMFQSLDRNSDGSISAQELSSLAFGGRQLEYRTAFKLVRVFDKDFSGTIDRYEFAAMHKFLTLIVKAFDKADNQKKHYLTFGEAQMALRETGFQMSPPTFGSLFNKYATKAAITGTVPNIPGSSSSMISLSIWIEFIVDIALLRSRFERSDVSRSGQLHVNFDQLAQLSADI